MYNYFKMKFIITILIGLIVINTTACQSMLKLDSKDVSPRIAKRTDNCLWNRMRQNFRIQKIPENHHPYVNQLAILYSKPEKNIKKFSGMGAPFMHYVLEVIEAKNLPSELALIPLVESGFNPQALSNKGAAGIWQILAPTGRQYGLKIDKMYDGRLDIITSTEAALKYLKFLHREFDNDWMLAIAAYNAGEGTLRRAINKNIKAGLPIDVWSLPLPKQTRHYVGKVIALAEVIAHPEAYEAELSPIANQPFLQLVAVQPNIKVYDITVYAEMNPSVFKSLNPGYANLNTFPKAALEFLLPVTQVEKFHLQLAAAKVQHAKYSNKANRPTTSKQKKA